MSARTLDQRARRHLRLFPAWMRAERGEEAVGLVLDLLPPDARHLPLRSRVDLVRAGLHARRVGTPPLWVWLDVLTAGPRNDRGRVPTQWRPWLWHWTSTPGWAVRQAMDSIALWMTIPLALGLLRVGVTGVPFLPFYVGARCAVRAHAWRRRLWERNGLVAPDPAKAPERRYYAIRNGPAVPRLTGAAVGLLAVGSAGAVVGLVRDGASIEVSRAVAPVAVAVAVTWVLLWMGSRSLRAARPLAQRYDVHDSRANRWALSLGVGTAGVLVAAAGLASVPVCLGACVALLVLRQRCVRRAAELGRPVDLWEVAPLLGPGATIPLPPESQVPAPPIG